MIKLLLKQNIFILVISKKCQKEFLLLCTTLRINPPVVKEELEEKQMVLETRSDNQQDDDKICDKNTCDSQRDEAAATSKESDENEYLENLQSPKADSDEETPEHISDFLNQLNKSALNTNNNDDSKPDHNCDEEEFFGLDSIPEVEDTFKMPESFDIPQDYIKEIFPKKSKFTRDPEPETPKAGPSSTGPMFDKTLRDEYLDNGNTLVQDEVIQITYKKDSTSKRNQGIKGKLNPKRDRKKIMADLFNDSDSDSEQDKDEAAAARSPTPSSSIVNHLEEKRNRVRDKLSTENVGSRKKESFLSKTRKVHHSSFNKNEEDEKFIVPDDEVSGSEDEDDPDLSSESEADDRRKRLEDRKKKKGGDVLAWMNKKAKIKVNVQTTPKSFIQDLAQYK